MTMDSLMLGEHLDNLDASMMQSGEPEWDCFYLDLNGFNGAEVTGHTLHDVFCDDPKRQSLNRRTSHNIYAYDLSPLQHGKEGSIRRLSGKMGVLQQSPARKSFLSPAPRLAKPNKYDGKPKTPSASTKQPQVEKPPREPSVDPTEVAEKAEKALRAAGGSPAVTGGNLNNTVSKTGRVRKAATVFVAESSFEFNRRREREAKAAEALRKRKRAPPAKFIAEPSHLANQRRGGDDETTVEKTAPATAAPPRTPTATAPTRAKAKSRTRTDKTDAAGTEAKTEVKRIRIRKPDLRRGRQRNRASGSRPRKPPPPVVVEQEESEEESEEGSDEESEQESEEEEEVERPAKGAKTKCVSAAEVEVAGGEAAIGRRLRIFWREERKWFKGTIRGYLASSKKHRVVYDDGDKELVNLALESFQWLDVVEKKKGR